MISQFAEKIVLLTPPAAKVNNGAFTVAYVDTLGFDYVVFDVILGAVDIGITVLKLTESDVSGSGYTDIVGSRYGTDNNDTGAVSVVPDSGDSNEMFSLFVDLRGGRKRYIQPAITIGSGSTGGYAVVTARLGKPEITPYTAAGTGYTERMVL